MRRPLGSLIGAVSGLVFVLVNAGGTSWATGLRVAAALSFVAVGWFSVVRVWTPVDPGPPPGPAAVRTYWRCVLAEVVALPLGSTLINRVLHRPELTLPWVVAVVGAHFLPFARAFRARIFAVLGAALLATAVVGGVVSLRVGAVASAWTGVLAGFELLVSAAWAGRGYRRSATGSAF